MTESQWNKTDEQNIHPLEVDHHTDEEHPASSAQRNRANETTLERILRDHGRPYFGAKR